MIQKTKIFVEINLREKKIPRQHAPTVEFKQNYVDKLQVRYFLNPCTTFNVENKKNSLWIEKYFCKSQIQQSTQNQIIVENSPSAQ